MIESIKVAGITYDVEFKELEIDEGMQLGWCKFAESKIEINNHKVSEQKQKQTLIHEMTHAIFNEAGIELEDEENIVNKVGIVLHQVLKDNDFSFLQDKKTITIYTSDGKTEEWEK